MKISAQANIPQGLQQAQRMHAGLGDQRFRQSMSLAVNRNVTARANWASRWMPSSQPERSPFLTLKASRISSRC
jgi:hypothetical protein